MTRPRQRARLVLGLMSGTSADGIDVALVRIGPAAPRLQAFAMIPFPPGIRSAILRVAEGVPIPAGELSQLNFRMGQVFAGAALRACRKFKVSPRRIGLIGSHGQTVYHQGAPSQFLGAPVASTLQIGEPAVIAARTGIITVADFRPADMAAGGQGAPLVPLVDYLLYRHARIGRAALNIGGIANLTVIPRAATPREVFAFDTGPGNMIVDALVNRFTRGRQRYDRDAGLAVRGSLQPELLKMLLADPYFRRPPPKTAGREQYGQAAVARILAWGRGHRAQPADLVRTATILTALSIVDAIRRWVLPRAPISQLVVSGGGARNPLIMAQLAAALGKHPIADRVNESDAMERLKKSDTMERQKTSGAAEQTTEAIEILRSDELGVPADAKEAFAFALLANETMHGRPANLPAATGAACPAILGKICYPPPLRRPRR